MTGFWLDIVIEYPYRTIMAFVRRIQSRLWPAAPATVTRAYQRRKSCGCRLAIVRYRYFIAGEKYTATHDEPFLIDPTGGFMRRHARGTEITVRYKEDDPARSVALI
ncbi:MAG TPA: DUF3592 domain-containing protein [Acidobacteriaceae bacterium]|nr:DUF3592 domain-containing protein [Acidobacteriaceae bacterium]